MKFITVSELRNRATQIVTEIENDREEVIVTKNGKPVVLMKFITGEAFSLKEDENERAKEKGKHGKGHL
jgi:PHD/YefM family antitoxin component YafN of YafNO toxin-antitoxin module